MIKNFIDRFYEEDVKDRFWSLNKKIGVGLVVLFLAVIMINTTGCTTNQADNSQAEDLMNIPTENIETKDSVKVGNDGVNAAIAGDENEDVSIVANQDGLNRMVTMSVEDTGRADPFLPAAEVAAAQAKAKAPSYILPPPEMITEDIDAVNVIKTKVSGIMYDKFNPSAILNIGGADHLVRSGDIISNYKVLSISPDNVTVQLGNNVYKAGVGQLFTGDGINYNNVANLEGKFGGSRNVANKRK